jgi:hypothetical protein
VWNIILIVGGLLWVLRFQAEQSPRSGGQCHRRHCRGKVLKEILKSSEKCCFGLFLRHKTVTENVRF